MAFSVRLIAIACRMRSLMVPKRCRSPRFTQGVERSLIAHRAQGKCGGFSPVVAADTELLDDEVSCSLSERDGEDGCHALRQYFHFTIAQVDLQHQHRDSSCIVAASDGTSGAEPCGRFGIGEQQHQLVHGAVVVGLCEPHGAGTAEFCGDINGPRPSFWWWRIPRRYGAGSR